MARCCPPNKPHCNSAHADALGRDSDDACCSACTATCIDDHTSLQAVFRVCLVLPSFCPRSAAAALPPSLQLWRACFDQEGVQMRVPAY